MFNYIWNTRNWFPPISSLFSPQNDSCGVSPIQLLQQQLQGTSNGSSLGGLLLHNSHQNGPGKSIQFNFQFTFHYLWFNSDLLFWNLVFKFSILFNFQLTFHYECTISIQVFLCCTFIQFYFWIDYFSLWFCNFNSYFPLLKLHSILFFNYSFLEPKFNSILNCFSIFTIWVNVQSH